MEDRLDLRILCNELNDKCAKLEEELIYYKQRFCPKYMLKSKLFAVNANEKKIEEIKPDEIIITIWGISYREYLDEQKFKQFPETLCFSSFEEANAQLEKI
jgi:hypothetical protein